MEKKTLYTKLIRIRYNQKIFDIFGDEDHQKTFLEVKTKDGKEEYYYPTLKDYIGLNSIYNKPFDGVVYSKKYSFQSKVMIATYMMGLSLIVGQGLTSNYLDYRLSQQPVTYEPPQTSVERVEEVVVEPLEVRTEKISFSLEDVDPSMYYKDGLDIMVYDNEVLTALGVSEVSFDGVRLTLEQNQKISPEYKEYMGKFLDLLEAKMPEVDLRVLDSNWKDMEYALDISKEDSLDGSWDFVDKKLHLKEEYIDSKTGKFDEKTFIESLAHELVHTLNYGNLIVTNPSTSEELVLHKFFQRTNYGESFSEGITAIITDYLLSDAASMEEYFEQENLSFGAYKKTTPICYQVYKAMDNYDLYDFINKDISYFDTKVTEAGFEDTILIVDTYHESLEELDEDDIINTEELDQLLGEVLEKRVQKEIENGTSYFKILSTVNDISLNHIDKFKITAEFLEGKDDGMIYFLTDQEKNAGLTEEEQVQKGFSTLRIDRGEGKEPLNISSRMVIIYSKEENFTTEYRLAYLASDQEYHDCQTDEIVQSQFENYLGLSQVLPDMDILIRNDLLKDSNFIREVNQKLEEKREELKKYQEQQAQREAEKTQLKSELEPLISEAISSGVGDLELCRMVSENTENLSLGMDILSEYRPDSLIVYRNPVSYTENGASTMISFIHTDGIWKSDDEVDAYVIYQTGDETGINYHLGKLVEENGENHLYDDRGNPIDSTLDIENTYQLKEVLPEIEKYSIQMKEEFLSSIEFRNLMEELINEKNL